MQPASGVLDLFLALAAIPSPSCAERPAADWAIAHLRALGLDPQEDDSAPRTGGDTGTIVARLPATEPGTPIFLCAHLDTVPPTGPIEPAVENGVVRNAAGTILGADNKASVAAMLVALERILAEGRPHAGIELVLTPQEELACIGARAFDSSQLQARIGFVFDEAGPPGKIILGAPTQKRLDIRFHGRAAHAGMVPEEGRSAIQAAARAIADLRLGRIDDETTANVGLISGGTARNIVPETCTLVAEARSHDDAKLNELVQEMLDSFAFAGSITDCRVEATVEEMYHGYRFGKDDPIVALACRALAGVGLEPRFGVTGGGTDGNVFNESGLPCLVLSSGMEDIHSPDEHIAVEHVESLVEITLGLVDAARDAGRP